MRFKGILRGLAAGAVAGAVWWLVEALANRALGGLVPSGVAGTLALLDVALGAVAGAVLGALLGRRADGATLALGLAAVYALARFYDPPGLGAEAAFALLAVGTTAVAVRLAGTDRTSARAFLQLIVLASLATAIAGFAVDERAGSGAVLPFALALVPAAAVLCDRVIALGVRGRLARAAVAVVAAGIAALVWGRPLATAPIDDPIVTGVPPAGAPDVILIVMDTTRADHLSTYGYGRETSPELTTFATDALLFTQARSPAAWTLPGHASLFTGMYPTRHGAHFAGAWLGGQSRDGRPQVAFPLAPEAVTMAEVLRDRGYRTGGFVANFSYLYRDFGVAQGFGRYEDAPGLLLRLRPAALRLAQQVEPTFALVPFRSARDINASALAWLDAVPPGRPAFLFVNYMEAHQPRLAPTPHDRWTRELPDGERLARKKLYYDHAVKHLPEEEQRFIEANYDGEVAAMDQALGELLRALRARGRYDNALVVVTADHGEFLGEHGQLGHIGQMLYEPVLHVPLVVKFPGAAHPRGSATNPVQLVDVLPTVVAVTGAAAPPDLQGQPLPDVRHPSLAEEDIDPFLVRRYGAQYDRSVRVLYDGSYKLIRTSRGEHMLFDLARDPEERNDLATVEPERAAVLLQRLESTLGTLVARN
jgi:arylsulfatase A-like enzyme